MRYFRANLFNDTGPIETPKEWICDERSAIRLNHAVDGIESYGYEFDENLFGAGRLDRPVGPELPGCALALDNECFLCWRRHWMCSSEKGIVLGISVMQVWGKVRHFYTPQCDGRTVMHRSLARSTEDMRV